MAAFAHRSSGIIIRLIIRSMFFLGYVGKWQEVNNLQIPMYITSG